MGRQVPRRAKARPRRIGRLFDPDAKPGKRLAWGVGLICTILVAALGWVQFGVQVFGNASKESADLRVSAFSVAELRDINAKVVDGGTGQQWEGQKIETPVIDIVVKNPSSQETAVLSSVKVSS